MRETQDAINDVSYRLRDLRREDQHLAHKLRYHWDRRLAKRREWVCDEIERLDKKLRRLNRKKRTSSIKYAAIANLKMKARSFAPGFFTALKAPPRLRRKVILYYLPHITLPARRQKLEVRGLQLPAVICDDQAHSP